jgi:DNA polymerase-1
MTASPPDKTLVLVDGSSFLFRAFHALPPLTNSRGEPTGAVFGVANMLKKLLAEYDTPYVAIVFDAPGRTFRNDAYEHYKAQRPPMPEELSVQIGPLHAIVRAMGLPLLLEPDVEADDVIGTLARQAAADGFSVVISTGDKDMAQLVCDRVTLENTMFNTRLDVAGVREKFGVPPELIVDYLALVGDASDNIPGVPKVGPKTAAKWLGEYGSLAKLIERAGEIGGKVGESLRSSLAQIPLARSLATIKCDVPLRIRPADLRRQPVDKEALRPLLGRLEFSSWLRQLDAADEPAAKPEKTLPDDAPEYEAVLGAEALQRWLDKLEAAELFAFDTETTSLDNLNAEIVGVSFAVEPGRAAYVPFCHDYPGAPEQLSRDDVLARLKPLLEDSRRSKLGQNLKYDIGALANHGVELGGIAHDTMLESYVLNSTATRHDMDSMARAFLGKQTVHYEDVAGKGAKQIPFQQVDLEQAVPYAAEDADITLQLHLYLWPKLKAEARLKALYEEIEMPLVPVLSRMERTGVLIDSAMLAKQSLELAGRMADIEKEAFTLAGQPFNLGSPKQIQAILYDQQKIPMIRKTPTGQPSTDESVLQDLAQLYALPRLILEHRSLSKLRSTYTDCLPQQVNRKTGRVHTSYHQAVAATGRLSSSNPNLQNIPARTEEGRRIRRAFIAPLGHRIVAADYSQIELRIMAHLSGDESLLGAFAADLDIHRATAAEVFGGTPDDVTAEQRRSAKAINFGLIYGMSAFGLARQLGIDQKQAQSYIDVYFARYPGVRRYMDDTRQRAREQGYVETLFGRRLYIPDINARNGQRRQYAERTAINAPMQGTAADIIKRAMIALDAWIRERRAPVRMIMQVHDELVFEVADEYVDVAIPEIRERMCQAASLDIPLMVDTGVGLNWEEAH